MLSSISLLLSTSKPYKYIFHKKRPYHLPITYRLCRHYISTALLFCQALSQKISAAAPLYVCDICPNTNEVVLGSNEELFRREADVIDFNWISGSAPAHELRCKAKIRYRHPEQWATVMPVGSDAVHIVFDEPQRAITPGQAAVLYDGDTVLGGGVIQKNQNHA